MRKTKNLNRKAFFDEKYNLINKASMFLAKEVIYVRFISTAKCKTLSISNASGVAFM